MPDVKITELIEMLDKKIAELKAGDPGWSKAQKKKAKDTIDMMRAFRVLAEQQCSDAIQSVPGPSEPMSMVGKKAKKSRKR
jgi:hypothetical protein